MIAATGLLIVLPMIGGMTAYVAPAKARTVGLAATAATVAALFTLLIGPAGEHVVPLGGFAAPLGIELRVDGLTTWMLLVTASLGTAVAAYVSHDSAANAAGGAAFWRGWLLLWAGMNALYLSNDLFNLYVTLEIVSVAAVSLVPLAGGARAAQAALRYLLFAVFGSLAFLLGVALVYAEHGVLALDLLADALQATPATLLALALLTLGLLVKTAVFPFHVWLPEAHGSAPAAVSALLSGLVVKASFYVVIRLWAFTFAEVASASAAQVVAVLGVAAIVYGSVQALRQKRLKLLIAFSTVAQLGYLCLALPLLAAASPGVRALAYAALAMHVLTHALAKAALFLASGSILHAFGTDGLGAIRGFAGRLPITAFSVGLAGMALIGLPPTAGFAAKWWLAEAALADAQGWLVAAVVGGGLLTAMYVFRVLAIALLDRERPGPVERVPSASSLATFGLALAAALLGLWADEAVSILAPGVRFGALPFEGPS